MSLKSFASFLLLVPLFLITVSALLIFKGCSSDDTTVTPPVVNVENEAYVGKAATEVMKICATANSYLVLIYRNQPIPSGTCPVVTVDSSSKKIDVDYGTVPCISPDDSVKRSGKYTINYFTNTGPDSAACKVTFTNYRVYRTKTDTNFVQISGDDDIGFRRIDTVNYVGVYDMNNNYARNNLTNDNINMTLNVAAYTGVLAIITDDNFSITGTGSITAGGTAYTYAIDSNNPLRLYGNCRYPRYGKVTLSGGNINVGLDFTPNSGGCDPFVGITKEGVTVIFNLELVN